jgi:DNA mismatch repair ATPase MutS
VIADRQDAIALLIKPESASITKQLAEMLRGLPDLERLLQK